MTEKKEGSVISRRDLLKAIGATSALGLVSTTNAGEADAFGLLSTPQGLEGKKIPTFCEICFWNCGVMAHVSKNRILYLTGHPDYPNARGKLCGRGNAGAGFVRDPDRLKYPMVRVGDRGSGYFKRVGWETAYKIIAEGFKKIKKKYGPQALGLFYHGKGGPMFRTMMVAFGSPNYAAPAYAQCKGPREIGYKLTFGQTLGSPEPLDFEKTKCMIFFGSHLGENAHNSQVQDFVKAKARGAKLIVLDPRLSVPAARADVWLPVRPGSDTAIMLAWMHMLIKRKEYHKTFVEKQCVGFEELAEYVKPFTPEWAAKEAEVPVESIKKAYKLIVQSMPAVLIHPGRHVTWYGEADTHRARAQAILNALLGSWWAEGGTFRPSRPKLSDFPGPDFPDLPDSVDKAAGRFPFAKEVTTNGIRDATLTEKPYPIKGWFVHATNILQSMPNTHQTLEAIKKLDMLVVCDIMPSEITRYADVILPEDIYLERYDDFSVGAGKKPYIGLRQPVVTSPYDTRPAWRIAKELGTHLGVGDFFAFDNFEEYLSARLKGSGTTLAQLKRDGIYFAKPDKSPYMAPDEEFHWHTPSGKVELYSQQMKDKGFSPLPEYVRQPDPPKGMMRLLYGRSPLHTFGRSQNNEILFGVKPTNCLWIHPKNAKFLGIKEGDAVMVENEQGDKTGPLPVKLTERVKEQTVFMVHGFGHKSKGLHRAYGVGGSDTEVIHHYAVDPITGGTGMRVQFVKIRPVDPAKELYKCATG